LIQDAAQTQTVSQRELIYKEIQEIIVEHAAYLWITQLTSFHVERENMYGYIFNPMHDPYFYHYYKMSESTTESWSTSTQLHNLYWGVDVGDRLDFIVTNTMTSEIQEAIYFPYEIDSGASYFIVNYTPPIPEVIDTYYQIQLNAASGPIRYANGTEWYRVTFPFAMPIGDWEFLTTLVERMLGGYQVETTDSEWGFTGITALDGYEMHGEMFYQKTNGFLSKYITEIYNSSDTTKLAEIRFETIVPSTPSSSTGNNTGGLTPEQIFTIISWSITLASTTVIVIVIVLTMRSWREQ